MSNIYIQEPPTNGKVLLETTVGDIDIELWSKEVPKACRNFVQLCLEGYYDGTIFHRVIKGFLAQGGDPTGTGAGGESIYGAPFKDEFHSRLRFVRRGLVAMASSGKDSNESQFFFTLGACPDLQNKHTIFGKVTGNTIYNMIKLEEGMVNANERPLYPHKIISTKVLSNPFPDIVPRTKDTIVQPKEEKKTPKGTKNFKLLSFGDEAEEEEIESEKLIKELKGKSKSKHDLVNDPKLSSVPAILDSDSASQDAPVEDDGALDRIKQKFKDVPKKEPEEKSSSAVPIKIEVEDEYLTPTERKQKHMEVVRKQIKELKRELKSKDKEKDDEPKEKKASVNGNPEGNPDNELLTHFHQEVAEYRKKSKEQKEQFQQKGSREKATLDLLSKFQDRLREAKEKEENSWMTHTLKAEEEEPVLAHDANVRTAESYDLSDPRNPLNQRRREEKQHKNATKEERHSRGDKHHHRSREEKHQRDSHGKHKHKS